MPSRRTTTLLLAALLLAACGFGGKGASGPSTAATPAPPSRLALVIGNAAYVGAPVLKNPVNDANDLCAALRRLEFEVMCHIDLRDRAAFEAAVERFVARLGPATVGLFYFSGHGVQAGGANYLVPTQVAASYRTAAEAVRALYGVEGLLEQLGRRPAQLRLVVLDACRTDLFAGSATAELSRALGDRGLAAASGLAPIRHTPEDTFIFYATGSGEAAYDGEGRNGPLTKHVLANLRTPAQPISSFFTAVIRGVQTDTARAFKHKQTPYIYGSYAGRFCFAGCDREIDGPR